jgi:hypothetical protein
MSDLQPLPAWRSFQRRSKICSMRWKFQSKGCCGLGTFCKSSARFLPRLAIPPPARKTFDAEGEALEHTLTKSFRIRNEAMKSSCSPVRRFRPIRKECKIDCPHALRALWKELNRRRIFVVLLPNGRIESWQRLQSLIIGRALKNFDSDSLCTPANKPGTRHRYHFSPSLARKP